MPVSILEREAQRAQWRRIRESLRLTDPSGDDFGKAGIGSYVEERSVRLLILPSDPEANLLSFDNKFWEWWCAQRPEPATGVPSRWLTDAAPAADAAVRYHYSGTRNQWKWYLALSRSGALEMEIGRFGAYSQSGRRYFQLIGTIGRIWFALSLYAETISQFAVEGPWEITLALCGTEGANLGNLGTGWADPSTGYGEDNRLRERNCLFTQELETWPDTEGIKSLAFRFGDRMDDAWGFKQRRYCANTDQLNPQFDAASYRADF